MAIAPEAKRMLNSIIKSLFHPKEENEIQVQEEQLNHYQAIQKIMENLIFYVYS